MRPKWEKSRLSLKAPYLLRHSSRIMLYSIEKTLGTKILVRNLGLKPTLLWGTPPKLCQIHNWKEASLRIKLLCNLIKWTLIGSHFKGNSLKECSPTKRAGNQTPLTWLILWILAPNSLAPNLKSVAMSTNITKRCCTFRMSKLSWLNTWW